MDTNQSDKLLRLLDTVVIKLEGGSDEDLKVLDEKPNIEYKPEIIKESITPATNAVALTPTPVTNSKPDDIEINSKSDEEGETNDNDENGNNESTEGNAEPIEVEPIIEEGEKVSKKRKRTTSGSSSSSSSSGKVTDHFKF